MKWIVTWVAALGLVPAAGAGTYLTKPQALEVAFPDADRTETKTLFLTTEEVARVETVAGGVLDSKLFTFYVGRAGDRLLGYAAIEAATVRTLPQTLLIVLRPDASVSFVKVLAFFEPEDYLPSDRWLAQFRDRQLSPELRVGGDIQAITGATLSAQAVAGQVRKAVALAELLTERTEQE